MRLPDTGFSPTIPAMAGAASIGRSGGGAGGGFTALMRSVDTEVRRFIANGSGSNMPSGLTPEAASLRIRMSTAPSAHELATAASLGVPEGERAAFLSRIAPWAEDAGRELGVAPELVAAHAALESGWGRQPLRSGDGSDSNNLFGIKATGGWKGATTDSVTTEFSEGEAFKTTERFRRYTDLGDAFQDYTRLLRDNPRYQGALHAGEDAKAFAKGLAAGGYATDPAYASKLEQVARQIQGAIR